MKKLLTTLLLLAATMFSSFADPDAFTVSVSGGRVFTISRTDASAASYVDYFTQSGSAIAGINYEDVSGRLEFAQGETTKYVVVTQLDPTKTNDNKIDGYSYLIASRDFYFFIYNNNLALQRVAGSLQTGSILVSTSEKQLALSEDYISCDDAMVLKYNNTPVESLFSESQLRYFTYTNQTPKYKFNVELKTKEVNDGYYYIGIFLNGKYSDPWSNATSNAAVPTPTGTFSNLYNACWERGSDYGEEGTFLPIKFPVRNNNTTFSVQRSVKGNVWNNTQYWSMGNKSDYLYAQAYNSSYSSICSLSDGYFIINGSDRIGIATNASGNGADCFAITQCVANVQLYDDVAPVVTGIYMNTDHTYSSGERVYVSVRFNEMIMSYSGTPTLKIGNSSYTLTYVSGLKTNTLSFYADITTTSTAGITGTATISNFGTVSDPFSASKTYGDISGSVENFKMYPSYSVTLQDNGGTIIDGKVSKYTYTLGATLPTNITKTGCTFGGWYTNSNFTGSPVTSISTTDSGNKTYYAKWNPITYKITFNPNGGILASGNISSYTYGTAYTLPSPAKTGYTFAGWYAKSDLSGTNVTTISSTEINDKTFYAKWTANTYYIAYNAPDKDAESPIMDKTTCTYDAEATLLANTFERTGYSFGGWATSLNSSVVTYTDGKTVKNLTPEKGATINLYAVWTPNTYTILFSQEGASEELTEPVQATYDAELPTVEFPERIGYVFDGYFTGENGAGEQYYAEDGTPVMTRYKHAGALTLYIKWKLVDYIITYNNNGGTITTENYATTYNYGTTVTLPEISRNGCEFDGWYPKANFISDPVTEIGSNEYGNKDFYAKWNPITYDVTLHPGDGEILGGDIDKYTFGVGAMLPTYANMKYEAHYFVGWYDNEDFEGDVINVISTTDYGKKEFWAKWDENGYAVTLQTNGGIINSGNIVSYKYQTGAILPTNVTQNGYEFAGWYDNSSCVGIPVTEISTSEMGDKIFWAKWTPKMYSVTFNTKGGTINNYLISENYTHTVGATLPTNVTRYGYTFAGWFSDEAYTGNPVSLITTTDFGDKEYWAKWVRNIYDITYNANGGTINENYLDSYTFGLAEITLPTDVTREGYKFDGWYDNANFTKSPITKIEIDEIGNKTFYAKWLVNSYNVSLNANGGTINSGNIINYTYGYGLTLTSDVKRNGYTFAGWYADKDFATARLTRISETMIGDLTLYAKWTKNTYLITLNVNDGSIDEEYVSVYTFGEGTTLPTNVTRNGYKFMGWFVNSNLDGSAVKTVAETEFGDKTFWAKWQVETYSVVLQTNGGTINSGNLSGYTYGVGAVLPTDVVKEGYSFAGWFADEEFNFAEQSVIAVNETGEKTFYAKWIVNDYSIQLNANGGIVNDNETNSYTYGIGAELPTDVVRSGFTFAGWYDNSNLMGEVVTAISTTEFGNKSFWAKWTTNIYTIEFDVNGGTINTGNVASYLYGSDVILPTDVTRQGYSFTGWHLVAQDQTEEESVVTVQIRSTDVGDKMFYAWWSPKTFSITYFVEQGTINESYETEYQYGTVYTLPTDVTREGYTFAGWYSNSNFSGSAITEIDVTDFGNKTFYVKWTLDEYNVSVDYDKTMGSVTGADYYEYKSPATLKAVPNEGYEFVGWNDNTLTDARIQFVVTKDTTLTANFKEKEKVQIAGSLEIPTLKTECESAPIDLTDLFVTTEGSEISYSATSSAPNVVAATVSEGKLFLTVYEYEGESEITVTATLPNGEKNSVKATANVVLACNIQVEETITNVSCFGESDGEIALKVTNAAEPYTTQWTGDNGFASTEDTIRNIKKGDYVVSITDAEGCGFTRKYSVNQPDEMSLKATVKNPTCENADGSIAIVLTGAESASFAWSNEATSQNIANLAQGTYSVVITNTETGCQISDSYTLVEPSLPIVTVSNVLPTSCNEPAGAITISVSEDGLLYNWSNNKHTKNLTNVPAGDYTLNVINPETNCTATLDVTVPSIPLKQPEIALVTVSEQTGKNLVVWLKENTDLIDFYTIYRESERKDVFEALATVPYSELSVYEDEEADPNIQPWRYKISATDVCGEETAMSEYHTTMHIAKVAGADTEENKNQTNLIWNAYEGIDYESFIVMCKHKENGKILVDTLATLSANFTSYTVDTAINNVISYYVGVKLPEVVNPKTQFMKAESGPFSLAISNIAEVENVDDNVSVQDVVVSDVEVYSVGHTIYVRNAGELETTIYNINGRKLITPQVRDNLEVSVKLDGVYVVKVGDELFKVVVK